MNNRPIPTDTTIDAMPIPTRRVEFLL